MDEATAERALRQFGEQSGLALFLEQYIWLFVAGFALLFVKESVTNALAGIAMFLGSDYNENMVCYVHTNGTRRPARIAKTSLMATTFYLYEVEDNKITGFSISK